jgi:hypothetical protein
MFQTFRTHTHFPSSRATAMLILPSAGRDFVPPRKISPKDLSGFGRKANLEESILWHYCGIYAPQGIIGNN